MKQNSIIYSNYSSSEIKNILLIEKFKDVFSNTKQFVGSVTETKISISTVGGSVTYLNGTMEQSDKPEFKTKIFL